MSESILVVKRKFLDQHIAGKNGLISGVGDQIVDIISEHYEFLPRPQMEEDPRYKQIIPYVALRRGEDIYVLRRLKKGGEARLHGLLSIGVGGHINPVDEATGADVLLQGMRRELDEEVNIEHEIAIRPLGVINDDTNAVGSVHLCFLFELEVEGEVTVRETEKLAGEWVSKTELQKLKEQMETWSQIAMEVII